MRTLIQDLHYSFRMLRNSAGFTITTTTILALLIGSTTTIFSTLPARHATRVDPMAALRHE